MKAGRINKARAILEKSVKLWPKHADTYLLLLELADEGEGKARARPLIGTALACTAFSGQERIRLEYALQGE